MRLLNVDPEALRHIVLAGVFCISPESFSSVADSPHPVDDVVFMTRGETSHITPLTGQEGMTRLIQAASGESDRTQAFDTVGRIAKRAQFSEMTNGRLEDSLDILWGAIDR